MKFLVRGLLTLLGLFLLLSSAACAASPSEVSTPLPAENTTGPTAPAATPVLTTTDPPAEVPPTPSPTPQPQPNLTPSTTPVMYDEDCKEAICVFPGHFLLKRPIKRPGRDTEDPTYLYGSSHHGARETHLGVELVNSQGTPVYAAEDGQVVYAGSDSDQKFAQWHHYYGNLVIIKHDLPSLDRPIYTLYGHLYQLLVETGDQVQTDDKIGLVGSTGSAIGSHLHFEVRYGDMEYTNTRNPSLWLEVHSDDDGNPRGAIAGLILDEFGELVYLPNVVVERLAEDGETVLYTYYLETYAGPPVNGDDLFQETFARSDLPAGKYRVSFVMRGIQVFEVEVYPGMVTKIFFDARPQASIDNLLRVI